MKKLSDTEFHQWNSILVATTPADKPDPWVEDPHFEPNETPTVGRKRSTSKKRFGRGQKKRERGPERIVQLTDFRTGERLILQRGRSK